MNLFYNRIAPAAEEMPLKKLDGHPGQDPLGSGGLIILGFAMAPSTLAARVTRRYMYGTSFHKPTPRPAPATDS
jgi:hypothetical protein